MRKINWKRALEPHLWASISVIGAFVYQLSMLSEHASAESIYPTSFMIPSLIALGAIKVSFLSNTKYKANNNPLPSSPLIINSPAENNQLSNEIQHYQLLIEREIWKYENIKGWVSYELHEDICQTLIAARNHLYSHLPQQLIPSTQIEQARVILEEAIHKLKSYTKSWKFPHYK